MFKIHNDSYKCSMGIGGYNYLLFCHKMSTIYMQIVPTLNIDVFFLQSLAEDIENHNDKVDGLRNSSQDMSQRVSQPDRELLDNQIRSVNMLLIYLMHLQDSPRDILHPTNSPQN